MKRITILGSNSGRNAGDAAILASIMSEISSLRPDVEFEVPTTNPIFIKNQYSGKYRVKPISVMPWNLSLRLLGLPVLRSIARTDLTLITDGIIFDVRLFNPAFNFLITLIFLVPFANWLKKPVVCFCVGVGPLNTYWGKRFAKLVGNRCRRIFVREKDSFGLMRKIGVSKPMDVFADIAFRNTPCSQERAAEIMREQAINKDRGLIGINVTAYGGTWLKGKEGKLNRQRLKEGLSMTIERLINELNIEVILLTTQIMDIPFAEEILAQVKYKDSVKLVSNKNYSNHELMGLMGQMDLFVGMRLHSLILAAAMEIPIVGLVYAPKVMSLMELIGQKDYAIKLSRVNPDELYQLIREAWGRRQEMKSRLQLETENLKAKAHQATVELANNYL